MLLDGVELKRLFVRDDTSTSSDGKRPAQAMTVFVTGATGFVGSAVARQLVARGETVRVLARPGGDRRNLENLRVTIVEGDLRHPESYREALRGCRALFHVAADYRLWTPRPADLYRVNVEGTRDLLRAAAEQGIERMVYTSSVAALGNPGGGRPGDETTPVAETDMIGHYKRSKFLAEQQVRRLVTDEGLPVVIVHPSTPIGPRDVKPTPTGRIVVEAAAGRIPAFVDTGLNIVHVEDVASGHLLAFDRGRLGEGYILGGQDLSLAAILTEIARLTGRQPPRVRLPRHLVYPLALGAEGWARLGHRLGRRTGEPFVTLDGLRMAGKTMFFSHDKAAAELGYSPRPAERALGDAIEWFRANRYF